MTAPFVWPTRIYWEDTDAGGVVYYANYLKFMERARTEWLRSIGVEQGELLSSLGLLFAIVHADVHYRQAARYGDLLQVTCRVTARTRTSVTFAQNIYRGAVTGTLITEASIRAVCLDGPTFRPRPLPECILQEIE